MATIDDDLSQIERDIRTLKIEYEQFFGGRYNERVGDLSFAQRFRFNNLQQTYAKYQDMWRKKVVQKETGAQQHHYGAAAKAIEAQRAHKSVQETEVEAGARRAFALSFSNPAKEREKIQTLYDKLVAARTETGESAAPSLKDFERFVQQKTKDLQEKGGREIEYSVSIEDGRVKLKARVSA